MARKVTKEHVEIDSLHQEVRQLRSEVSKLKKVTASMTCSSLKCPGVEGRQIAKRHTGQPSPQAGTGTLTSRSFSVGDFRALDSDRTLRRSASTKIRRNSMGDERQSDSLNSASRRFSQSVISPVRSRPTPTTARPQITPVLGKARSSIVQKGGVPDWMSDWMDKLEDVKINSQRLVAAYSSGSRRSTGESGNPKGQRCTKDVTSSCTVANKGGTHRNSTVEHMKIPKLSLDLVALSEPMACSSCSTAESLWSPGRHEESTDEGSVSRFSSTDTIDKEGVVNATLQGEQMKNPNFSWQAAAGTETIACSYCRTPESLEGAAMNEENTEEGDVSSFSSTYAIDNENAIDAKSACSDCSTAESGAINSTREESSEESCISTCTSSAPSPRKFVPDVLVEPLSSRSSIPSPKKCVSYRLDEQPSARSGISSVPSPKKYISFKLDEQMSARSCVSSVPSPKKYASFRLEEQMSARSGVSSVPSPKKYASYRLEEQLSARSDISLAPSPKKCVSFDLEEQLSGRSSSSPVPSPRGCVDMNDVLQDRPWYSFMPFHT